MTVTANAARSGARSWGEPVARAGYLTKGGIYASVGGLALQAAIGDRGGGATTGTRGAVETIGRQLRHAGASQLPRRRDDDARVSAGERA